MRVVGGYLVSVSLVSLLALKPETYPASGLGEIHLNQYALDKPP